MSHCRMIRRMSRYDQVKDVAILGAQFLGVLESAAFRSFAG